MRFSLDTVLGECCTWWMLYLVDAVLGGCCTWWMLYLVDAVLGGCCTWWMLYSVDAVLGGYYPQYTLYLLRNHAHISNNPSFGLKHPGVPDGSDGSGGTSYPLTENQTRPVAWATGRVPYLPCGGYYTMPCILATRRVVYYTRRSGVRLPLLCVRNVVTYTHHRNDTYVTLFAGVAVMQ